MRTSLEKITEIIKTYKTFAIYTHVHTDIDAVGSALALKNGLESLGKIANVFVDSQLPENAYFLKGASLINNEKLKEYDVAVVLDLSDESRLGRLRYKYKKNTKVSICVDHHLDPDDFCRFAFVNDKVSSTCELICELLKLLNVDFTQDICKCLISGILTDTGGLKFSSAYPSTFKIVGELLQKSGLAMDEITYPLFNSKSIYEYNLWKVSINNTQLFYENQFALITITQNDFKQTNTSMKDTKGLTDNALLLESVKVVVLVSEDVDGIYYLSIRTKSPYSAKTIAEDFGGGGHLKAAGCKIAKSLEEAKTLIHQAVKKEFENK
ncbi:MAG: bifunctional oligoribonuclease/PAP phosphatase NrnA [Clostridia bacterium]|nr:bifunctional oligoribonuclease/PAP phosphatase NrnA [Clostridia bacterium]